MNLQIAYLAECEVTLVAFLQLFSTAHFITSVFALKQHGLALNTNTGAGKSDPDDKQACNGFVSPEGADKRDAFSRGIQTSAMHDAGTATYVVREEFCRVRCAF